MATQCELDIRFLSQADFADVPQIKAIEVVTSSRVRIKRVVNGVDVITDYLYSGLADGEQLPRPYTDTVYRCERKSSINDTYKFHIAAGIPSGEALPENILKTLATFPAYPYLVTGETETSLTATQIPTWLPVSETDTERKARIRKEAVAHARACIDLMNSGWVVSNTGALVGTSDRARWKNTRLWILSGLAVIDAILDSTETLWDEDVAEAALAAYKSLVPANRGDIETWYFAHNSAIWTAYFGSTSPVPAYFKWTRGAANSAFASDAASSTQWVADTTNNDTLAVTFSANATPESFSS